MLLNFKGYAIDYSAYCSLSSPDKNFKGNLASLSSANFLARKIAAYEISKELKEKTNTKFKVHLDNFYGVSLTDGIFKNLSIEGKNFIYEDMIISKLNAETLCPYNHIQFKDNKITYVKNMVLNYNVDVTQEDLNKSIQSTKFQKMINKINEDKYFSTLFKIENMKTQLQENRLALKYTINPLPDSAGALPFMKTLIKPFDVTVGAGLRVENNRIELCDLDLNSRKIDYTYFLPFVNLLNPLDSKIKLDRNNEGDLKIDNIKIEPSKISIKGAIIVMGENNK